MGNAGVQIPGRELPGEVATRRLWSVCKALGVVLLDTEDTGLAETPPSEAFDLETKIGALLSKCQRAADPGNTGRVRDGAQQCFQQWVLESRVSLSHLLNLASSPFEGQS